MKRTQTSTPREDRIADAIALQKDFLSTEKIVDTTDKARRLIIERWCREGRVFSVLYEGRELFPAFQFSGHGRPLRRVAELLEILRRDPTMTDWDIAIWFTAPTGWLSGQVPSELLTTTGRDRLRLEKAAQQEVVDDD